MSLNQQTNLAGRIRPATPDDTSALLDISVDAGMFLPDEVGFFREVLDALPAEHQVHIWTDERGGPPIAGAYFGPNAMSERGWELLWIAVSAQRQGEGIGGELLRFAEQQVQANKGRMLLIETSSLPKYQKTRAFYLQHGYSEVARIPDFYTDGESKVIFAKRTDKAQAANP